jgi:hypothetical protein
MVVRGSPITFSIARSEANWSRVALDNAHSDPFGS